VAETTVKRLLCCGFRHIAKAMGQVYQCWWRICQEVNVFPSFEYHMFYVLYPFVTYLLTLPRIRLIYVKFSFYCKLVKTTIKTDRFRWLKSVDENLIITVSSYENICHNLGKRILI
jgi:hypothetical protein